MELAAKKTKREPVTPPNDEAVRDGCSAPVEVSSAPRTRCLVLLANRTTDPTEVLRSFRRRPVEIEIFTASLDLLAELGRSANSSSGLSRPVLEGDIGTFQLPTIVFMVEPELNADTRTFMAVIRKYFPAVILLAHTEDPSATQLASVVADTRGSRAGTTVVATVVATAKTSESGSNVEAVPPPCTLSKPEIKAEAVSPPSADDFDAVFAPPFFGDIEIAGKISENGAPAVFPIRPEAALGESSDTEAERLISEEELAMLLGNGNFIFSAAEPEADVPASRPLNNEGGLEGV